MGTVHASQEKREWGASRRTEATRHYVCQRISLGLLHGLITNESTLTLLTNEHSHLLPATSRVLQRGVVHIGIFPAKRGWVGGIWHEQECETCDISKIVFSVTCELSKMVFSVTGAGGTPAIFRMSSGMPAVTVENPMVCLCWRGTKGRRVMVMLRRRHP